MKRGGFQKFFNYGSARCVIHPPSTQYLAGPPKKGVFILKGKLSKMILFRLRLEKENENNGSFGFDLFLEADFDLFKPLANPFVLPLNKN